MGKKRKSSSKDADVEAANDPETPPAKRQQQRRQLFLRSLASTTTTESLIEHFSQSFPVKHATAVTDPATKTCKGYGFITFTDAEDAKKALEEYNGSTLLGRKIKAELAEPRHRDLDDILPNGIAGGEVERRKAAAAEARAKKEQDKKELLKPPKLIVRNLPWSIKKSDQLTKLFLSYGKIKSAVIPEKKGGLSAGFGFVVLRGKKNAEKAIEGVNGKEIDGRTLAVDYAVDKEVWAKQVQDEEGQGPEEDQIDGMALNQQREDGSEVDYDDLPNGEDENVDEDDSDGEEDVKSDSDDEDAGPQASDEDAAPEDKEDEDFTPTLFIRNLPFTTTDPDLHTHFTQFGRLRYARCVLDPTTDRPKGTAFVCFVDPTDAQNCLRSAPPATRSQPKTPDSHPSLLQSELDDPTGRYTLDGRTLNVTRAVNRTDSSRLASTAKRGREERDKRRAYLLSEGTIPYHSAQYQQLSQMEVAMREASLKQRQSLIKNNPSLHLSLTRLSVRNVPRSVNSKDLKALARDAVVGFATQVKEGKRARLSKEELARGGQEMVDAEKARKKKGKGLVKQAKVVFEGREGGKVAEESGAGRSRGYGFIEYHTHRAALMGLRWLNGHVLDYKVEEKEGKGRNRREEAAERKKRLIVEFAIENAQVLKRRKDREVRGQKSDEAGGEEEKVEGEEPAPTANVKKTKGIKGQLAAEVADAEEDKQAKRQRIINRKRAMRRGNRKAAKG